MRPKLEACLEAVAAGVSTAVSSMAGCRTRSLLELFTDAGQGTMITAAREGPLTLAELQALERDVRDRRPTSASPVAVRARAGTRLWDEHGNEYLDFLAGISVLNVGHCHPRVVAAAIRSRRPG